MIFDCAKPTGDISDSCSAFALATTLAPRHPTKHIVQIPAPSQPYRSDTARLSVIGSPAYFIHLFDRRRLLLLLRP